MASITFKISIPRFSLTSLDDPSSVEYVGDNHNQPETYTGSLVFKPTWHI